MITGVVNSDYEAIIRLTVLGPAGQRQKIRAVIDTGFDGYLSLRSCPISLAELPAAF
jgi:predicted aspartyl protease